MRLKYLLAISVMMVSVSSWANITCPESLNDFKLQINNNSCDGKNRIISQDKKWAGCIGDVSHESVRLKSVMLSSFNGSGSGYTLICKYDNNIEVSLRGINYKPVNPDSWTKSSDSLLCEGSNSAKCAVK